VRIGRFLAVCVLAFLPVLATAAPAEAASGDSNAGTPMLYVHGFDPAGSGSNCGMWSAMRNFLTGHGFTGAQVSVKYYHNDGNCSVNLNNYGSQSAHFPGGRVNGQNSNNTDIRHIGYQFAWFVYNTYSSSGQNVGVVAHSMGGLVVRYALARVAARDPDFPPSLSVSNIVTLGTPHNGANIALLCTLGNIECAQMAPGSSFLRSLGQNPQAAGGTDWTLVGSQADAVVSYASATSMAANHKVRYASSDGLGHSDYYNSTRTTRDASLTYSDNGAAYTSTTAGEWPVLRSQKALSGAGL
jgi:triacylglycerol esterase/lipase EstA (alpha/beta hydrolase family)